MIRVDVFLPDPAGALATGAFGAGALIRIERSPTSSGTYAEVTTLPIVATTLTYTYWDPAGDATSWYRWRVSNSGNTVDSPYSDPFQGSSPASVFPTSYATLAQAMGLFTTAPNAARQARLATLLGVATSEISIELEGRDYFRHPATGSATWYFSAPNRYEPRGRGDPRILHAHDGIVALDTLEISQDLGGSFVTVTSTDYVLRGSDPESSEPPATGEPYFHVVLTGLGTIQTFPRGTNVVRGTGARGWPAIPAVLTEAVAERARQLANADPSYTGSVPGESEYGSGPVSLRWPQVLYNFLAAERHRFWCQV